MLRINYLVRVIVIAASLWVQTASALTIQGRIDHVGRYRYRVSLFHLRTIDQFDLLTSGNLVAYAFTDSTGAFALKANFLPNEPMLYRLHIRKIEYEKDSLSDLIDGTGGLAKTNYIFLPLHDLAEVKLDLVNAENIIQTYRVSPPSPYFDSLYSITRNYDRKMDSIHSIKPENGSGGIETELAMAKQEGAKTTKLWLKDQLFSFIRTVPDQDAAVLAYFLLQSNCGPDLSTSISCYELIKKKGADNPYLGSIQDRLDEARQKDELAFLRRYAIGISVLMVLFMVMACIFFVKNRRHRRKIDQLTIKEVNIYAGLTRKELEIFEMVAKGMTNKEIASTHFLEVSTVKKHISNIYSKTGIRSRQEAMMRVGRTQKKVE